jgi:cytochrome P450 family 6
MNNFCPAGLRFAVLQSKIGLVTLLKNYKIKLSPKTRIPLTLHKKGFIIMAEGGVWLDVEKINNNVN